MKGRTIKIFLVLALISILGIVITQIFWFRKVFETTEMEFNKNVNIALKEVVNGILVYNNTRSYPDDPVKQLGRNYFAVMVNDRINEEVLEHYLKTEFKKFNISEGFEYSIYDCANKKMVTGKYITGNDEIQPAEHVIHPKYVGDNYYFTVYFPHKIAGITANMGIWLYSSLVVLVVVIFFVYSLFVILKQKRLWEVQSDFINNMAHEIRTPLTTISISAHTIKKENLFADNLRLNNYSNIIINEALKLKEQVDRILAIADDKVIMHLKIECINLNELLNEMCISYAHTIHNNVNVIFEPATHALVLAGDRLHLNNLFANLIENAIKYSTLNGRVKVSAKQIDRKYLEVIVSDNGIGIGKEYQKKVFDKFFRVPTGNIHNVKGFGIGLFYVKQIARAHRGNVNLKSSEDKGCSFIITLPIN